jgi:hypothetical protein
MTFLSLDGCALNCGASEAGKVGGLEEGGVTIRGFEAYSHGGRKKVSTHLAFQASDYLLDLTSTSAHEEETYVFAVHATGKETYIQDEK